MFFLSGNTDIMFPGLGITLENVGNGIEIFGFKVAYYGICIGIAMILGYLVADFQARRTKQNPEQYLDFAVIAIIISVICARLYYVAFKWEDFASNPLQIFNLRTGGLAIYGGVIGGVASAIVYTRLNKLSFRLFADTACVGLLTGQIIGRWGNFFNREAFGSYTDGIFRMLVDVKETSWMFNPAYSEELVREEYAGKTAALEKVLEIRNNAVVIDGATYISVHPTFLYESFFNLILLCIIMAYTRHKKADGELFLMYVGGYGLIRFFIEGLRSDQLLLWGTGIAVSQVLAAIMFIGAVVGIVYLRKKKPLHTTTEKEM
ncbi:MAG: prolipoprotein diacylglyceryl transferase [Lachnospiraceae bacterium]